MKVELCSNELDTSSIIEEQNTFTLKPFASDSNNEPAVEIQMGGTTVRFYNNTNPDILKCTLECLGGTPHAW